MYKKIKSLATIRVVNGLRFRPRHEKEEWLAKRLQKERDIKDNGVKYLGQSDYGSERAALFHGKMGGGKTRMMRRVLLLGERSVIHAHSQTIAKGICSDVHKSTIRV